MQYKYNVDADPFNICVKYYVEMEEESIYYNGVIFQCSIDLIHHLGLEYKSVLIVIYGCFSHDFKQNNTQHSYDWYVIYFKPNFLH